MEPAELPTDIQRLEQRIETLQDAIVRCRKIALAAKIAIAAGAVWLTLTFVGATPYVPTLFFASLAALIGGVVLLGSNSTTWQQTEAALAASQAMRHELIEQLELRVIDDDARPFH